MKRLFSEIPYIETERLVLRKIEETDEGSLSELVHSQNVYRYLPTFLFEHKYENIHDVIRHLPTFLFEHKYENIHDVIRHLYDECFRDKRRLGLYAAYFR